MGVMPSNHYVNINGYRMHYREWGASKSPTIILVHGWSTSSMVWHEVAEYLARDYHIIAPDMRGNGESASPSDGFSISDFADDVKELIRFLEVDLPFYGGNSWGANIGTFLAAEYPSLISKAILEDPVYRKMKDAYETIATKIIKKRSLPQTLIRDGALKQGLTPEQADREVYLSTHFDPDILIQVTQTNRKWAKECDSYLSKVAIPTLILVADPNAGGYITTNELEQHQVCASRMVKFEQWEGIGHMMHLEQPRRFINVVHKFFRSN